MTMVAVKICGVTRERDAVLAAECGAWAVGFVFAAESPRCVTVDRAIAIASALPATVQRVGVFIDAPVEAILAACRRVPLDLVQLHGAEPPDVCRSIGLWRCIKAVELTGKESVARAVVFDSVLLLADRPKAQEGPIDLALARDVARRRRMILAGGLTPGSVIHAVRFVEPWGVDVSSGIESAPGIKDPAKLRAFCDAARSAQRERGGLA